MPHPYVREILGNCHREEPTIDKAQIDRKIHDKPYSTKKYAFSNKIRFDNFKILYRKHNTHNTASYYHDGLEECLCDQEIPVPVHKSKGYYERYQPDNQSKK